MVTVTWGWKGLEAAKYILEVEWTGLVGGLGSGHKERTTQSEPRFLARATYQVGVSFSDVWWAGGEDPKSLSEKVIKNSVSDMLNLTDNAST